MLHLVSDFMGFGKGEILIEFNMDCRHIFIRTVIMNYHIMAAEDSRLIVDKFS